MTSQALNRPVDVLAKIRAACDSDALPYEVYCAVAELIEADREYDAAHKAYLKAAVGKWRNDAWPRVLAAKERRAAALAAIGSQP